MATLSKGKPKLTAILVDDDNGYIELFSRHLSKVPEWDIDLQSFSEWPPAQKALDLTQSNVMFIDHYMGAKTGIDIIKEMRQAGALCPLILLTGAGHESLAIEAIRSGADDYINKHNLEDHTISKSLTIAFSEAHKRNEKALIQANLFKTTEEYRKNVAELEMAHQKLSLLATEDFLTGLANRRHFDAILESELRRARRAQESVSLLFCDVDYFKQYNDVFGHPEGDLCLQKVAQEIRKTFTRSSDFPARFGGEEFAVILPLSDAKNAPLLAEKLRAAIESLCIPHQRPDGLPWVTMSIGVFTAPPHMKLESRDLILHADQALYVSKHSGRNTVTIGAVGTV